MRGINFACDSRQQQVQFRAEYPRFVLAFRPRVYLLSYAIPR